MAIQMDIIKLTVERYQSDVVMKNLVGTTASDKRKQQAQFSESCGADMEEELMVAYKKAKVKNMLAKSTSSSS